MPIKIFGAQANLPVSGDLARQSMMIWEFACPEE